MARSGLRPGCGPSAPTNCIGGKLHYILKHRIVARVEILRFEERRDGRIDIVCSNQLELVSPMPKRAHQGWRYLEDQDAPTGDDDGSGLGALPPRLYGQLAVARARLVALPTLLRPIIRTETATGRQA